MNSFTCASARFLLAHCRRCHRRRRRQCFQVRGGLLSLAPLPRLRREGCLGEARRLRVRALLRLLFAYLLRLGEARRFRVRALLRLLFACLSRLFEYLPLTLLVRLEPFTCRQHASTITLLSHFVLIVECRKPKLLHDILELLAESSSVRRLGVVQPR